MAVFKSTATAQLLIRKKKAKKKADTADTKESEKTRIKSIKKSLHGKVKST